MIGGRLGLKRKHKVSGASESSVRKKIKRTTKTLDDLPWKTVKHINEATLGDFDDGILELEEVDDVYVAYEETDGGKIAKFNVVSKNQDDNGSESGSDSADTETGHAEVPSIDAKGVDAESNAALRAQDTNDDVVPELTFDTENLLPDWLPYPIHAQILSSLYAQGFKSPTPIQSNALPIALSGKDVIGVAQTGSGKTLAYGIPILHHLMTTQPINDENGSKREVKALILAPTRELALQVSSHLQLCLQPPTSRGGTQNLEKQNKVPPRVSVAAIVGGMSSQKQRRVLDRGVDIVVATPGRLWDLLGENDKLAEQLKRLRFLVLDEADRMIETGHFAELDNIIRLTLRLPEESMENAEAPPNISEQSDLPDIPKADNTQEQMQTFVFSATLSKDLQRNLKKRSKTKGTGSKRGNAGPASTLDDLLLKLDFRDPTPEVIDLSPVGGVVSTLQESHVECLSADKDVYLYYFLLRYPGRSLVFLSSIDGIRRLLPLLELLQLKAFPLHSQLQQKQRLKNLDRFKSTKNAILLATDVASRGLDIPAVDHVIHYQIPRSTDVYIHRNGRTARAMSEGFSLLMCAPDERRLVRELLSSLGRLSSTDIPEMAIELDLLDKLKSRVQLARKIDVAQHRVTKDKHDKNWMKEAAEAMEIELDSDFVSASDEDDAVKKKKSTVIQTASLKAELRQLLSQPLIARGISKRYITSGELHVVQDLMDGKSTNGLVGFREANVKTDLLRHKKNKPKPKPKKPKIVD